MRIVIAADHNGVALKDYLIGRLAAEGHDIDDLGSHGDAKGDWARFFVMFDPSTLLGIHSGAPASNAYTAPDDAAHNAPYEPGGYQRLMPYAPALAGTRN